MSSLIHGLTLRPILYYHDAQEWPWTQLLLRLEHPGVTQWQLHDVYLASRPPMAQSLHGGRRGRRWRYDAACGVINNNTNRTPTTIRQTPRRKGVVMWYCWQPKARYQWTRGSFPPCGQVLVTLKHCQVALIWKKLSPSQTKMERQVPDVFNVFALGEARNTWS